MNRAAAILQSDFVYRFRRDKVAVVSFTVLMLFVLGAVLAPVIAPQNPYDQTQIELMDSEIPPIWQSGSDQRFLLGTDNQGRDMLSTILYGTGISLLIGGSGGATVVDPGLTLPRSRTFWFEEAGL